MSDWSVSGPRNAGRATTQILADFNSFRTAISAEFVPLRLISNRADQFRARVRSTDLDSVHFSEISATQHSVERTPELIARSDNSCFKLNLQLAGHGMLVQDGRETLLGPGELAIYSTSRPYTLAFDEEFRTLVVMFPKQLLGLPADVLSQLTAVRMSGREGVGSMVVPFLGHLAGNISSLKGAAGVKLAHSAIDLIAAMFSETLDVTHLTAAPHTMLRQNVLNYIEENLHSPDLSPPQIATAHFISTRHLHAIFSAQGETVSSWIRTRRLEYCRRDLMDPAYARRPVAVIAGRWGFTDAAHFSRMFKSAFGAAPSEYRQQHLNELPLT